jgi:hypothetical protein
MKKTTIQGVLVHGSQLLDVAEEVQRRINKEGITVEIQRDGFEKRTPRGIKRIRLDFP